ncbi:unnamed protein product [Caenorhabditis sp. 36 PRJEB53466]|nr:unnamed protein product [Caenorhabditis sp. 36 PRJEB53466]
MNGYGIKETGEFYPVRLQFDGHRLCGSGRFSNVYNGQMIAPIRREVAVKNVWSDSKEFANVATITDQAEIQILAKLFHPAISNLLFFYGRKANDKIIHCLVLDYLPQEMAKLRDQGFKFDTLDAKIYTFQLFCAIAHLAAKNIVHMDVKPQNVIMNQNSGLLKLADFGNARRLESHEKTGSSYQVTRFYRPPELLFGCERFSSAIDTWSATGKDTKDQIVLITGVFGYPTDEDIKSIGVRRPRVTRKEARGIETFTSKMLDADVYDLLKSTLKLDPKKRKSAAEVLKMSVFDAIRAVPRKRRSNGAELPTLANYTEMHPKRELMNEETKEFEEKKVEKKKEQEKKKEKQSSSSNSEEEEVKQNE